MLPVGEKSFYTPATEEHHNFSNHVFECIGYMGEGDDTDFIFKIRECHVIGNRESKKSTEAETEFKAGFRMLLDENYPLTLLSTEVDIFARDFFHTLMPTKGQLSYTIMLFNPDRSKWAEHVLKKMGFAILDEQGNRYSSKNSTVEKLPSPEAFRLKLPTSAAVEKRWLKMRLDVAKAKKYGISENNLTRMKEKISIVEVKDAVDSVKFVELLNGQHHDVVVDYGRFFMHDLMLHVVPTVANMALEATDIDEESRYVPTKVLFDELILQLRSRIDEDKDEITKTLLIEFLSRLVDTTSASFNDRAKRKFLFNPNFLFRFAISRNAQYFYSELWIKHLRSILNNLSDAEFKIAIRTASGKWKSLFDELPCMVEYQKTQEVSNFYY